MLRTKKFNPDKVFGPLSVQTTIHSSSDLTESLFTQLLEINSEVDKESCICRNCEKDFKNRVCNADYVP